MSRYYIGQVHRSRKRRLLFAAVCLVIGLGVIGSWYVFRQIKHDSQASISNAPSSSRVYNVTPQSLMRVNEKLFTVDLPAGWTKYQVRSQAVSASPVYAYRSSSADSRSLIIYLDNDIPATLAVNKVVVVTANGNHIGYADVSDNCVNFTRPTVADTNLGMATGQWQGVSFLCDIGNYTRNVSGTASSEGQNSLTLTGQNVGKHRVFLTYTDNGSNPDYTVFYAILNSFSLK